MSGRWSSRSPASPSAWFGWKIPTSSAIRNFAKPWRHAQVAELEPGDALFIPYMWWHHVESLSAFNVLFNYWWDDQPAWQGSPFEALIHGLLAVRTLPPERRELWRKIFDHYVFQGGGDPVAHLTPRQQGIQAPISPHLAELMRAHLAKPALAPSPVRLTGAPSPV